MQIRSIWGWIIVIAMGALAGLFGIGVWFMIALGLVPAIGGYAYALAFLIAPIVAALSMLMFLYGETLKKHILDYEYQYGKNEVRDGNGNFLHYENKPSYVHWVVIIKWFVFIMDSAGIAYRVMLEPAPLYGKILLFIVLELLAYLPWPVGKIMYMVTNRPAAAVRRDVNEIINVADAHNRLREANDSIKKHTALPAHMRPAIEAPKQKDVFTSVSEEAHQTGK